MKRQRIVVTSDGIVRFKANPIVQFLYDEAAAGRKCDMNDLVRARIDNHWSRADMRQFYRLIGYSVSGYGDIFPRDPKLVDYDAEAAALGDSGAWPPEPVAPPPLPGSGKGKP